MRWLQGLVALPLLVGLAAAETRTPLRVEFDKLKGDVLTRSGHWLLQVEYEVEVKKPGRHVPALVLLVDVYERGRLVRNADGIPLQLSIPLDRPHKANRHEIEYESSIVVSLDPRSFAEAEFDLRGRVVLRDALQRTVVSRKGDADYDRPRRWRPWVGVGVGIGPVGIGVGF